MGKSKDPDRVVLDVGGTPFVTSKTTLSAWSSVLLDLCASSSDSEPLFLDVDPEAFAVLLSFMRNGSIESSQVTDAVLKQATHFQIDGLLTFVRNIDVVVVNVRGTRIQTSKELLMESSTWFRNEFSNAWNLTIFLNQDPKDFDVLLGFMTRKHMEQSKLTNSVLELAEFLGVERLLEAVKVKLCWMGSDERSLDNFHEEYGTITNAIRQTTSRCGARNLLDSCSTLCNVNLEYASVYLHRKSSASKTSIRLPFRATVYGSSSSVFTNELLRMKDTINLLNALGRLGFALVSDAAIQSSWIPQRNDEVVSGLGHILGHVVLCRDVHASRRPTSVQSRILVDNDDESNDRIHIQPKEVAALLRPAQELQSAAGYSGIGSTGGSHGATEVKLVIPSSDSSPGYWAGTFLRDPPDPGLHGALAWLHRNGFCTQEPILAHAFGSALVEMMDGPDDDDCGWASVLVFSKPLTNVVDALSPATLSAVMVDSGSTMESTISTSTSLDVI